jgi:hypothetical protein
MIVKNNISTNVNVKLAKLAAQPVNPDAAVAAASRSRSATSSGPIGEP